MITTEDVGPAGTPSNSNVIQKVEIVEEVSQIIESSEGKEELLLAQSGIFSPAGNKVKMGKIQTGIFGNDKIAVAKDRRRIYIGGDGLNILQTSGKGTKEHPEYELLPSNSKLKSKPIYSFFFAKKPIKVYF